MNKQLTDLIGLPFIDGGRDPTVGLDCWGLSTEVFRRYGINLPDYKISCEEYIEEVYTGATDIPKVNYSELETITEVRNVSVAEETYRQKDGTMVSNLELTLQSGTHINTEFGSSHYTCITFPGRCNEYPSTQCSQVGGSVVLKLQDGQAAGE